MGHGTYMGLADTWLQLDADGGTESVWVPTDLPSGAHDLTGLSRQKIHFGSSSLRRFAKALSQIDYKSTIKRMHFF